MKTIIIIPYRNREKHLSYFLENSIPKLNSIIPNLEVIIVEQTEGKKFNRGATINIGYDYYKNTDFYYITQDVDVNPIIKEAVDFYGSEIEDNHFLGIYSDGETLGGVVKFKGSTFHKINGFPNNYWGWGLEDKNLMNRAIYNKINIDIFMLSNNKNKDIYFKIFDNINDREPVNNKKLRELNYKKFKNMNEQDRYNYVISSGLNNIEYKIIYEKNVNYYIKKIKVDI